MRKNGFSLIEFIIVILIFGIIAGMGAYWLSKGLQAGTQSTRLIERTWQARLALQRIAHDLLYLNYLSNTSTSTIINFSDANSTAVSYILSDTKILRNGKSIATGILDLKFNFINASYNYTSNIDSTMCIGILTNVTVEGVGAGHGVLPLQTIICPRNL